MKGSFTGSSAQLSSSMRGEEFHLGQEEGFVGTEDC